MIYFEIAIAVLLVVAFIHFQLTKRKNRYQTALLYNHLASNEEMKKTLAMGLYLRFRKENLDQNLKFSPSYLRQNPDSFEDFVADIYQKAKGGSTWVTPSSGDFGVDFEHRTEKGLFLGQVKCYSEDLDFSPIALIHSNMVKSGAEGGYVITTSSFTPLARKYAERLNNIDLIDGVKLVELWIEGLEDTEQELNTLIPEIN